MKLSSKIIRKMPTPAEQFVDKVVKYDPLSSKSARLIRVEI